LAAQNAVERAFAFIRAAASPVAITIPISIAAAAIIPALLLTASPTLGAALLANAFSRTLAIGFGAFLVKFVGLVWRFVRGGQRNAFAFGRFVHCRWNVFIFVTRTIFVLGFAFAKFIFFAVGWLGAITGFVRRITFTRRTIVTAAASASSARSAL
jgi:hypothetical protein